MDLISSFTNNVVTKALDGTSARHTAIASNLANVDTPGFGKQSVSFEGQLQQAISGHRSPNPKQQPLATNDQDMAMKATSHRHVSANQLALSLDMVQPQSSQSEDYMFRTDKNAVDVEVEMVELAENTQHYLALANIQTRMMGSTRNVISSSSQ